MRVCSSEFEVKLGGTLEVRRDGVALAPPPTKLAAVCLVGLLAEPNCWLGRDQLAAKLYVDRQDAGARVALRQVLHRVREWVGADAILAERDRVRLEAERWSVDVSCGDGRIVPALIAPGLSHPWMDELRLAWSPKDANASRDATDLLAESIIQVATLDRDLARSVLVASHSIASSLSSSKISRLLAMTSPRDRRDPAVCSYLNFQGGFFTRMTALEQAKSAHLKAYRLANHLQNEEYLAQSHSYYVFSLLESGEVGPAREWLARMPSQDHAVAARLMRRNVKAAYFWNTNQLSEALQVMRSGEGFVEGATRFEQAHFWRNYSVLAAEAGDVSLSLETEARARALINELIDNWAIFALRYGEAIRVLREDAEEAVKMLERLKADAAARECALDGLYAQEALAEALAMAGRAKEAWMEWKVAEFNRSQARARLTPRLVARKFRIRNLC